MPSPSDDPLIYRILPCRTLHLDRQVRGWLIDLVVLSVCLEARRQHLNSQLSIRESFVARLALGVRLEFKAATLLLIFTVYGMQHHGRIAQRFAIVSLKN